MLLYSLPKSEKYPNVWYHPTKCNRISGCLFSIQLLHFVYKRYIYKIAYAEERLSDQPAWWLSLTYEVEDSKEALFQSTSEPKFESKKNNVENIMSNVCSKSHKALLGHGPSKYPSHWMLAILGCLILSIHVLFFKSFCDKSKTNVKTVNFFIH